MKETMWCIVGVNRKGKLVYKWNTLSYIKKYCIESFIEGSNLTWAQIKKHGWKCIKVTVTIEPKI